MDTNEDEDEEASEEERDDTVPNEIPAERTEEIPQPGAKPQESHIVQKEDSWEGEDPRTKTRMFCGLEATFFDDGSSEPAGTDFYDPMAADDATCVACKEGWEAAGRPRKTVALGNG